MIENSTATIKPYLEVKPTPLEKSKLIWINGTKYDSYKYWIESLDKFLQPYHERQSLSSNLYNCDYNNAPQNEQIICDVNIKQWSPCTKENWYGYHRKTPCIFLKLNTDINWIPEYYNNSNSLPESMPDNLKNYIKFIADNDIKKMNTLWISCDGEQPADKEFVGPINYYPIQGIPSFYYPYRKLQDNLSPLIAIQFKRPELGVVIWIECKIWAKNNQKSNGKDYLSSIHFELLVDS